MQAEDFPAGAAVVFGATGGIGSAIAQSLGSAGADVALMWNSKAERAAEIAEQITAGGRKASTWKCDVTDCAEVQSQIDGIVRHHGRIHTIVWAAGAMVEKQYIADFPTELYNRAFEVEARGFFHVVKAVVPHMRAAGGGSFVHIGSAGHIRWPEHDGLSVAPKAANEAVLRGLAREEGRYNIRANSVLSGIVEAGMFLELNRQGAFDDAWTEEVQKALCIKRWGKPEEIGHAVVYLASSRAAYVTGQQINVSGGYGI